MYDTRTYIRTCRCVYTHQEKSIPVLMTQYCTDDEPQNVWETIDSAVVAMGYKSIYSRAKLPTWFLYSLAYVSSAYLPTCLNAFIYTCMNSHIYPHVNINTVTCTHMKALYLDIVCETRSRRNFCILLLSVWWCFRQVVATILTQCLPTVV